MLLQPRQQPSRHLSLKHSATQMTMLKKNRTPSFQLKTQRMVLYVDGKRIGKLRQSMKLPVGKRRIELEIQAHQNLSEINYNVKRVHVMSLKFRDLQ